MTLNEYSSLKIGDTVVQIKGPNKNIPLRVTRLYYGCDGCSRCLSATPVNPMIKLLYPTKGTFAFNVIDGHSGQFEILK